MMKLALLLSSLLLTLSSCAHRSALTSEQVIATAQAYHQHVWHPTEANVKHGKDADGILVHTPDVTLQKPVATRAGYWKPGEANVGLPYQWGGFDTPETFDKKIAKGFFAGDVYTANKRQVLEAGVSRFAAGVDCSGFVSRCWQLPRAYSTRELDAISDRLPSYEDLKPGDILNRYNDHVVLFWKFEDASKSVMYCYEVGCPPTWVVSLSRISTSYLKDKGYVPLRYKHLRVSQVR